MSALEERLFRNSARLGLLLGALELPWAKVAPFVAAFPGEVQSYQELSVCDSDRSLGLMTRGDGQDFAHRIAHFMEERGIDQARLRRFLATSRHFEHRNLFFKVEAGPTGIEEMSWYIRRRPSVEVALAWLEGGGVTDHARVTELARTLGKNTVHFIAQSERADSTAHKLYFSQPDTSEAWQRMRACAALCGVEAEWGRLQEHAAGLVARFAFVSVGWQDGVPVPGMKVDIHDIEGQTLGEMLKGSDRAAIERIHLLLQLVDKPRVDYAAFKLRPGQPVQTRVYGFHSA